MSKTSPMLCAAIIEAVADPGNAKHLQLNRCRDRWDRTSATPRLGSPRVGTCAACHIVRPQGADERVAWSCGAARRRAVPRSAQAEEHLAGARHHEGVGV